MATTTPLIKSVWSSLKLARVYRENYATGAQALARIHAYLCFYTASALTARSAISLPSISKTNPTNPSH
jgi:hypothetical protein